jgi:reactive intermediate/imine deaminase
MIRTCLTAALVAATAWAGGASMQIDSRRIVRAGPDRGLPFSPAVRAGGFIYVSGTLGMDDEGRLAGGDVKAQTRQVLENIAGVLKAAGSGLEHAVAVNVYLARAADFQAMNEVYRTYWAASPPVRTTVVTGLLMDALVEMSMIAVPAGGERVVVHPGGWDRSPNPYSYGIRSGNTLFLAGLVSRDPRKNAIVTGDMGAQVRTIMEHGGEILAAAGMTFRDVVASRVYITDAGGFADMNAAYGRYFPEAPPARATVVADLMSPDYLVEISMTAVRDDSRRVVAPPGARQNPVLSPAIQVGDRLYLSGMLGNTPDNAGDARAQTRETLARIGRTLEAAGFDWSHIVDGVVYLTQLDHYAAMNEAYRELFPTSFPARATVRTGLVAPTGLVEIMFLAVTEAGEE